MRWCTRALIHFDRVGSAWLIARFVDPEATFVFLAPGDPAPSDAEPFGLPGVTLAAQDGATTTFDRVLARYALKSPALEAMARIVRDTVVHVMHDRDRTALASRDPHVLGFLAVTEGVMLDAATDAECLARSLPVFDALHVRLQAQSALIHEQSATPLEEARRLIGGVSELRAGAAAFSPDAFAAAVRRYQPEPEKDIR